MQQEKWRCGECCVEGWLAALAAAAVGGGTAHHQNQRRSPVVGRLAALAPGSTVHTPERHSPTAHAKAQQRHRGTPRHGGHQPRNSNSASTGDSQQNGARRRQPTERARRRQPNRTEHRRQTTAAESTTDRRNSANDGDRNSNSVHRAQRQQQTEQQRRKTGRGQHWGRKWLGQACTTDQKPLVD